MKKLLLASTIMFASFSAQAEVDGYLLGNFGMSSIDSGISSMPGWTLDENDTTMAFGGGIHLTENLSVEAGYADLGEVTLSTNGPLTETVWGSRYTVDGSISANATGYFFGMRGTAPLNDSFNVYGRAGVYSWESDGTVSGAVTIDGSTGTTKIADGNDFYFGFGAEFALSDTTAVTAGWDSYGLDYEGDNVDINTYTIGLKLNF